MTRDEALIAIAKQLKLNKTNLVSLSHETNLGGNDNGQGSWLEGPSWAVEGQV